MVRRVSPWLVGACAVLSLSGCGFFEHAERPAWRTEAEEACLARGLVQPSAYITPSRPIDGPGICGLDHPFKVSAVANGAIAIDRPVTLDCSMIPALESWLAENVQPIAQARFGQPVVGLRVFGAYSCRSIDNIGGAQLSEHAFANAIDVAGFRLADGRIISVVADWKKTDSQESAFLHEAHAGACQHFTTVLGPGADVFHYNHFHLDLAMHGSTSTGPRRYCKPAPAPELLPPPAAPDGLPPAPEIDEPMDVARAGAGAAAVAQAPVSLHGPNEGADQGQSTALSQGLSQALSEGPSDGPSGQLPPPPPAYQATPLPPAALGAAAPLPPARIEGRPADWDITSSIRRRDD
jgi:hypothetical protein